MLYLYHRKIERQTTHLRASVGTIIIAVAFVVIEPYQVLV